MIHQKIGQGNVKLSRR